MGFTLESTGSFDRTRDWLNRLLRGDIYALFDKYGQMGVDALIQFTPKDSGLTAESWGYSVSRGGGQAKIQWFNTNVNDGVNIAIIIQYGHGTGTGGYVSGIDYINPALRPIFDTILVELLKEVAR